MTFAIGYFLIGLALAVYTVREIHKGETDYSDQYIGFMALMTGVFWPIEGIIRACGLFARLVKPRGKT